MVLAVGKLNCAPDRLLNFCYSIGIVLVYVESCEAAWLRMVHLPVPRFIVVDGNLSSESRRIFFHKLGFDPRLGVVPILVAASIL